MRRALVALAVVGVLVATATPAAACSRALPPLSSGPQGGGYGTVITASGYCEVPGHVTLDLVQYSGASRRPIDRVAVPGREAFEVKLTNRYAPPRPPGAPYLFDMELTLECGSVVAHTPFLATESVADEFGSVFTMPGDGPCGTTQCPANLRSFTPEGAIWINQYATTAGRGGAVGGMKPFDERNGPRFVTGTGPDTEASFGFNGGTWNAYPGFPGGVNVAAGDVDGDGYQDIVTAAGAGGGPHVKVWKNVPPPNPNVPGCYPSIGNTSGFYAYGPSFAGGVSVAVADLDLDGRAEIITGALAGGGPHVRVFDEFGHVKKEFMAYDPAFSGGVNVAAADVLGDSRPDIVTGAGPGGGPHVRVFTPSAHELAGFYAYAPDFRGGVFVAAGHATPGGAGTIVTGAGVGGGPHVRVLDGYGNGPSGFYAYQGNVTAGVRVAVAP